MATIEQFKAEIERVKKDYHFAVVAMYSNGERTIFPVRIYHSHEALPIFQDAVSTGRYEHVALICRGWEKRVGWLDSYVMAIWHAAPQPAPAGDAPVSMSVDTWHASDLVTETVPDALVKEAATWAVSDTPVSLTCHITVRDTSEPDAVLAVGDYVRIKSSVRIISAASHLYFLQMWGAIGRVIPNYNENIDRVFVRFQFNDSVVDGEVDGMFPADELELVDIAALSSANPDAPEIALTGEDCATMAVMDVSDGAHFDPDTPEIRRMEYLAQHGFLHHNPDDKLDFAPEMKFFELTDKGHARVEQWRAMPHNQPAPAFDADNPYPPYTPGATADDTVASYEYEIAALKRQNAKLTAVLKEIAGMMNTVELHNYASAFGHVTAIAWIALNVEAPPDASEPTMMDLAQSDSAPVESLED